MVKANKAMYGELLFRRFFVAKNLPQKNNYKAAA